MSLVNGTSNSANQAEIDQAISLTRAARSDIFGQSQNAESIYASTFVAANSSSGYSTIPTTGASVFTPTGGVQTTYGNMVFSSNGIDSDFVKGYGLHLMNISARIDAEMAAMAGKSASGASGAAKTGSGATGPANINNSASPFSKLTEEQLGKLQEAEDTLQKAKEDVEKEEDADKKAELQKAADEAMENYRKLEQEYGVEGLSDLFGKAGNFYKGIDATELASIKNANTEIESMRSQLESMKKSKAEKWAGIQKKIAEYQAKNGKTPEPEVVMSEAEKDYFSRTDKEISELEQKITKAIKDLNANIKSSAAKADSTHGFATANAQRANERSQEERKTALGKAADSLTTKDAKLDDVKKAFEGIKGFDKADKEEVADFLYQQMNGDKDKLKEKAFFVAVNSSKFVDIENPISQDNLRLLEAVYNRIHGNNAFDTNFKKACELAEGTELKGLKNAYDEAKASTPTADTERPHADDASGNGANPVTIGDAGKNGVYMQKGIAYSDAAHTQKITGKGKDGTYYKNGVIADRVVVDDNGKKIYCISGSPALSFVEEGVCEFKDGIPQQGPMKEIAAFIEAKKDELDKPEFFSELMSKLPQANDENSDEIFNLLNYASEYYNCEKGDMAFQKKLREFAIQNNKLLTGNPNWNILHSYEYSTYSSTLT